MILANELLVEAPIDRVWGLLDELESVISCMPGAAYIGREGDDNRVSMKVKVGPISSHFQGTMRLVERNELKRSVVIQGAGKDVGGKASATARINATLEPLTASRTKVLVNTDLALTGRLAQFGGPVLTDIASRLIEQFTVNLHEAVLARAPAAALPSSTATALSTASAGDNAAGAKGVPAFDVGPAISSIAKRAFERAALPLAFLVLGWLIGRFF